MNHARQSHRRSDDGRHRTVPEQQPLFYPVLNEGYAAKIARDWNTKNEVRAGFVTRFSVDEAYADRFERRVAGSRENEELGVPAEELAEFNAHMGADRGDHRLLRRGLQRRGARAGALKRKKAREQLVALAGVLAYNAIDADLEVAANHRRSS
jgi:hypothetical protein